MLVSSIIKSAMRKIGAIASGATPTDQEYADGLEALQVMLRHWSIKKMNVFVESSDTLSLVGGTSTYSWGSGGDLTTTKPNKIERAFVRDSLNLDHFVDIITTEEFDAIRDKTISDRPNKLAYGNSQSTGYLYIFPVPSAAETLYIKSVKPFTETSSFSSISDTLAMPVTYEEPIIYNLAVRLGPEFGITISPEVYKIAVDSFDEIKSANASIFSSGIALNLPAGERYVYDINAG